MDASPESREHGPLHVNDPPEQDIALPAGYREVAQLSRHPGSRVVEALRGSRRVALRLEERGVESRSELSVLAGVDHPGVAKWVDFGALPGAGRFVARQWIEGEDLAHFARGKGPEALGAVVARLCPALEHLHARGFVHADLKAANVIVRPDGQPVLTDFGLARRAGEGAEPGGSSGSYYHIAPEILMGEAPTASADLFALGVLLHELLVGLPVDPRTFYGSFPRRPFLDVMGTGVDALPEWSRDLLARLLASDPAARPPSAAQVGRMLESRLGLAPSVAAPDVSRVLRWPALQGREAFLRERIAAMRRSVAGVDAQTPRVVEWWRAADAAEADALAREARIAIGLEGTPAGVVDLAREVQVRESFSALDAWASAVLERSADGVVFVAGVTVDAWSLRGLDLLVRAARQLPRRGAAPVIIVVCAAATQAPPPTIATIRDWPGVDRTVLEAKLCDAFEDPGPVAELAGRLHAECSGSATRLDALLSAVAASDRVQLGPERLRLLGAELPAWLGRAAQGVQASRVLPADGAEPVRLAGAAGALGRALATLGGRSSLDRAARLARLHAADLASALETLTGGGHATLRGEPDGSMSVELAPGVWNALTASVTVEERVELHRAAADLLTADGEEPRRILAHRYAAEGGAALADIAAEAERLRTLGCAELALGLLDDVREHADALGRGLEPVLVGEYALTLAALGEFERANERIRPLEQAPDSASQALCERVRGRIAKVRQRHREALEHLERGLALGGVERWEVLEARARLFFETGRDAELEALVADVDAGVHGAPSRVLDVNVHGFAAMALFRRGEVERAYAALSASLRRAEEEGDPMREAVVRINLGTVDRRVGRFDAAVREFERSRALYGEAGYLPGVAQTHSLLGGTLREQGQLTRAEPALWTAVELFERLGDRAGAGAARGMLGLLHCERGHMRAALDELEAGQADVARVVAAHFESRRIELRARLGERGDPSTASPVQWSEQDPRIDIALGRAAWYGGDPITARTLLQRGRGRARELHREALVEEASFLLELLHAGEPVTPCVSARIVQDARVHELLGQPPDALDARITLELASELCELGRDDLGCRVYAAVATRSADPALAVRASERARVAFGAVTAGLTPLQTERALSGLLGYPDPWPEDLEAISNDHEEDLEMEVLTLLDINRRLVEQQDVRTLLGAIVDSALEVTGAERGFLVLEEEGRVQLDLALDSRRGDIDEPEVEVSHSIVQRVFDEGRPLRLSNASDDPVSGAAPSVSALELRSILVHPFDVDASMRGAIYLDNRLRSGAFSERAERLLGLLAGQAALAIRQVRRWEEIQRLNAKLNQEVVVKETGLRAARRALVDAGVTVPIDGIVGDSKVIRRVHELLRRLAPSKLAVLVCGPSGTGKELAARALHDLSPWSEGPFVSESCAALPASLVESELFGFRKGAFTGADRDQSGLFERAEGGTLFLDEIGELSPELQAKLLRVLETHEVRRLGESESRRVDFRLVAATNRDLAREVAEDRFRSDLYYRLDGVRVDMPPLAERADDVPALVDHFLRLDAAKTGVERTCSREVLRRLCERPWPGNVRELANEVSRLCVLSAGDLVDPDLVRVAARSGLGAGIRTDGRIATIAELEREAIERALELTRGDKRRAAELLGISRAKVYQRLKEWEA